MPTTTLLPKDLTDRIDVLRRGKERVILGIAGAPGCGKSTLASLICAAYKDIACVVPMDGFHLANAVLDQLGLRNCKGAPETFDSSGFAALVTRIRLQSEHEVIYAPDFDRHIDAAIAGAIAVHATSQLVVIEGNYLLCDGAWQMARRSMHNVWFLDTMDTQRDLWLKDRHMAFGRSASEAESWIAQTDAPNARMIDQFKSRADWIIPPDLIAKIYQ